VVLYEEITAQIARVPAARASTREEFIPPTPTCP
jgi:hypothetical protein